MHYLPRYLWGSESGGQSGVSFFPAIHGRLSRPFEADSPPRRHPRTCPRKKIPAGRISPSCPGFPCRPDHCARVSAPGIAPAVLIRRKNMKKSAEKFGGSGKSSTFAIPFGKRGTREAPGREKKEAGESLRRDIGSSLTRLEEAVQAKYRKQIRER